MTRFVKKEPLKFAIDFDGVLTEDRRWITSKMIEYFGVDRLHNIHKKMGIGYLEITKEMNESFWNTFSEEFEALPICPDAVKGIQRLHDLGHHFDCLTARGSYLTPDYQERMRESTQKRIDAAKLPFDRVIFASDKNRHFKYDCIIDDDPSQHFDMARPMRRTREADWKQPFQHQICFGYESYNEEWMGDRISNFWELEALYPDIFSTRLTLSDDWKNC